MTHEALRERLLDLAYGELSPRAAREVEEHADSCEACRGELGRIRETRRLMSSLPEEPAPAEGERILLAAAREAAGRRRTERALPRWVLGGSLVAASLAAVVAVSYRVATMRPRSAGREDVNALMGESPYARPPPPESAPPAESPAPPKAAPEPDARREPPEETRRPHVERSRTAAAPPPASAEPAPPAAPAGEKKKARSERSEGPVTGFAAPAAPARPEPSARAEDERAPAPPGAYAVQDRARELPPSAAASAPPSPAPSSARPERRGAERPEVEGSRAAKAAAPAREGAPADAAPASDPVLRYEALRAAGRLRVEESTFPGCTHELWRRVERDPEGQVVAYSWEEMAGTQRLRLEGIYAPGGKLARKRAFVGSTSVSDAFVKFRAPPAWAAEVDAPPRCAE